MDAPLSVEFLKHPFKKTILLKVVFIYTNTKSSRALWMVQSIPEREDAPAGSGGVEAGVITR